MQCFPLLSKLTSSNNDDVIDNKYMITYIRTQTSNEFLMTSNDNIYETYMTTYVTTNNDDNVFFLALLKTS